MQDISEINYKILLSLSRNESHKLNSLIRNHNPIPKSRILELDNDRNTQTHNVITKDYSAWSEIIRLYELAGIDDEMIVPHWKHYFHMHRQIHYHQHEMVKEPRKDNKTYLNYGSGDGNRNKIRFPKKCRKTAWKRFYKLFPHLNPENKIKP